MRESWRNARCMRPPCAGGVAGVLRLAKGLSYGGSRGPEELGSGWHKACQDSWEKPALAPAARAGTIKIDNP